MRLTRQAPSVRGCYPSRASRLPERSHGVALQNPVGRHQDQLVDRGGGGEESIGGITMREAHTPALQGDGMGERGLRQGR